MANPYLPQEILIDVFSRLPTKSIGKFRCLSKSWRTLLTTTEFIEFHLTRKTHKENLILVNPSHSLHVITLPIENDSVPRNLELLNTWTEVVGSCNGLVLLLNDEVKVFVVNPITLQQVNIPDSPVALKKNESFSMYGFGYDCSNDDYKIVTLSYYDTDNEYEPDCIDTFVDVFSLKRGVWKRVSCSPYDHAVPDISSGAFVNGAIHWLASSRESGYRSVIAGFDLANEVFYEIPPPNDVDLARFVFYKLVVLGGCLCLVNNTKSEFWMMKEYGLVESWTNFKIDVDCEWDIVKPLCFIGDEEVMLINEGDSLVVYSIKDRTMKDMVFGGIPSMFIDGGTFVESLVSPDFNG
ncbi:hypothetical protein ACJIZ3_014133 [Penstemon smallii]|uniref:F-box domain-containing protein n=1 Tax=Penstemon smallii TaxID=265156 RepID=A0ABD3RUE4_9LAMI